MTLLAGRARTDITPESPLFLVGYPHVPRTATGTHDPLTATAVCYANHETALVAVAVDLLFLDRDTVRACRDRITAGTGIPGEHILLSTTHTHSGPNTATVLAWRDDPVVQPPSPAYMRLLRERVTEAAVRAWENRRPATMTTTTVEVSGVGTNRLNPDGIRDPEVGLVYCVSSDDGAPISLQVVYSMHPTVLHEDSRLYSADFPGYARQYLEGRFPGLRVAYHTGPCGNLSTRYHVKAQTFAEAQRLGEHLGTRVETALEALAPEAFDDSPRLLASSDRVDLLPRGFGSVEQATENLREAREVYARLRKENAGHGPVRTAECTVFGAEEYLTLARAQMDGSLARVQAAHTPAEVQVFRLGTTTLAALPGECFVEYALRIKREAALPAFVISLANDELQGYIVTPDTRGYEANLSLFLPESGDRMVQSACAQIRCLAAEPDLDGVRAEIRDDRNP